MQSCMVPSIGLGRRGSHPTGSGASGEMLYARTRLRRSVWDWAWQVDSVVASVVSQVLTH